ncbi:polyprenyl synthetase family protein [Amphibacillus xylanus]|uniref:Farnesyl diphosphate synthase n=1 Tax=Amphibacillus xylanus (strain ATCC 51415 / DSM 6626 / JCM 7361 / LMG 17667 / NBRC 15112 / Ep01) TaxID=698758 RepID=K0IXT9_AMPXN|nr:farnesyl diphosphate synthase [Amphibacillus xylanus]BAM47310.1 polyprenyl diphosphate synthase [Amphibacillus xylanus NBRC 15112]
MNFNFRNYLEANLEFINHSLIESIEKLSIPSTLKASMLYSIKAGGKRIRPILMIASVEAFGGKKEDVLPAAIALELVHTYSLIHDDLPAMDDDNLRRGQPTNHIEFGEATAILAGDSLLTLAFQVISEAENLTAEQKVTIIKRLSMASGPTGMVAGQILDLEAEERQVNLSELEQIHRLKTGELLIFAVEIGAYLAGAAQEQLKAIREFGHHIGLIFQIQDDILDIEGDEQKLGKAVGSDQENKKSTYPKLLGIEGALQAKAANIKQAEASLNQAQIANSTLHAFIDYISNRES